MRLRPTAIAGKINSIVRSCADGSGQDQDTIPLHEPRFQANEWRYVKECIDTGWVSSAGSFVNEFEKRLADFTHSRRVIVTTNGTAALHVALQLAGVRPGDEVLVPALTFVATANAVSYCGAVPHFVDSEMGTLGVDPVGLAQYLSDIGDHRDGQCFNRQTGRIIRALVPMHTLGHPVDLDGLESVCRDYGLQMIEDAAESMGSFFRSEHTGTRGLFGILSFNGNKIITTGGGGAILTNDVELAHRAKHLTTTAKRDHPWEYDHDRVGYNYRMPNINAALGCAQLERLPEFLKAKRRLAALYATAFCDIEGIQFIREPEHARSNYWLNAILLLDGLEEYRDEILELTNKAGVQTRPVWRLLPNLPMFKTSPSMPIPVAESLERRLISLPSSACLGTRES